MAGPAIYRPRRPQESALYQCLEQYWEEFQQAYTALYEKDHGPLRPVVEKTVERFLECGILRHGFARIRCGNCHEEFLLAFSCKTRYFCPSCQAKRVAAFMERVTEEVLEAVDHRQLVWTIPRVLRPTFRRDRRLLGELARCAWSTLKAYTRARFPDPGVAPGAIFAIQTYGDQLNFHPHLHSLLSDGVWDKQGQFHCCLLGRGSRLPRLKSPGSSGPVDIAAPAFDPVQADLTTHAPAEPIATARGTCPRAVPS